MKLLMIVLAVFSMPLYAQDDWDYQEEVAYQELHDSGMVYLQDGRQIEVDYAAISWEEIAAWPAGKKIIIGYAIGTGAVLQDPETGKATNIISGLAEHPLDIILKDCLQNAGSTTGMVACYDTANQNWDKELNAKYRKLMDGLDDEGKVALRDSQRAWVNFRDAQIKSISAIYDREGTLWRITAIAKIMEITREQAIRLNSYLGF